MEGEGSGGGGGGATGGPKAKLPRPAWFHSACRVCNEKEMKTSGRGWVEPNATGQPLTQSDNHTQRPPNPPADLSTTLPSGGGQDSVML